MTLLSKMLSPYSKRLLSWALVWLLLWAGPAMPETSETDFVPSLSASIDKNTVRIGDLVWVTLRYEIPEGAALSGGSAVGGFETLTIIENKTEPHQIKIQFLVDRLESFDLGPNLLELVQLGVKSEVM